MNDMQEKPGAGVRVIEVCADIMADNDAKAASIRRELAKKGTFMLNVMSSPGGGKTTFLTALINMLKVRHRICLMDVDIKTSLDAARVAEKTEIPAVQIHNGGLCHIDADMVGRALEKADFADTDLIILENIGNLVCPAEFDTGAHKNLMLYSITEGDDKPLKYPLMFKVCDAVMISKTDVSEYFDFDMEAAKSHIKRLNPGAVILPVSAKTGDGMQAAADWLEKEMAKLKDGWR